MNAKKKKNLSKKMKNFIRSKSTDINVSVRHSSYYLTSCILFNSENSANNKIIQENNNHTRRRTNSYFTGKNDKFYAATLFKEENFLDMSDYELNLFSDDIQNNNRNNNKTQDENFDLYEENEDLLNEFSKGIRNNNNNNYSNNNINDNNYFRNSSVNNNYNNNSKENSNKLYNNSSNNINNNIDSDAGLEFINRSNSYKKTKNNENIFSKNKDYFKNEKNKIDYENYHKTHCLDEKAKDHIDTSFISTQETHNYTDIISDRGSINFGSGRGKLKTRRNQVLSGMLNCDVLLGSSQITITNLDKTSLRKGKKTSICISNINENDETIIKEDKIES